MVAGGEIITYRSPVEGNEVRNTSIGAVPVFWR